MTETVAAPTTPTTPAAAPVEAAANAPTPVAATEVAGGKPSLLADAKAPEAKVEAKADAKADPKAETKPDAPYELKLQEGANADIAKEFAALGQEHKVPLEALQKAYDSLGTKLQQSYAEAVDASYERNAADLKADKELGGDNWQQKLGMAKAEMVRHGGDELLKLLLGEDGKQRVPLSVMPAFVRPWYRLAKANADDGVVTGGVTTAQTETERWRANNPKTTAGLAAMGAL